MQLYFDPDCIFFLLDFFFIQWSIKEKYFLVWVVCYNIILTKLTAESSTTLLKIGQTLQQTQAVKQSDMLQRNPQISVIMEEKIKANSEMTVQIVK